MVREPSDRIEQRGGQQVVVEDARAPADLPVSHAERPILGAEAAQEQQTRHQDEWLAAAERRAAARGLGLLHSPFIGSVARRVVHEARCRCCW